MAPRQKTVFAIPKMDCAAEERLIRMALAGQDAVQSVHADLASRRLTVVHDGPPDVVDAALQSLNLGSRLVDTTDATAADSAPVRPPRSPRCPTPTVCRSGPTARSTSP